MAFKSTLQPLATPGNASEQTQERQPASIPQKTHETPRLLAVLGRRDLVVFLVLIMLYISNVTGVQYGGPTVFLNWTLGLLAFLVPSAFVTQWLARRFGGNSASYLWVTDILGAKWGFFAAFCLWLPGVLFVVAIQNSELMFIQYFAPTWFVTPAQQCLGIVLSLLIATGIACIPLRWLKHILLVLVALSLFVFGMLGVAGGAWLWSGHAAAVVLNARSLLQPGSGNVFSVFGLIVMALVGINVPLFLSNEIRGDKAGALSEGEGKKHVSSYVWWGVALVFVAYIVGTFGIMVIVPAGQAGMMSAGSAGIEAITIAFGPLAGRGATILLILSQMATTIAYLLLFSRLLVVVARDHHLPASLTQLNSYGVPVLSIVVQAIIVASVTILTFVVVPDFFGTIVHPADLAVEIYSVLMAAGGVVWIFATGLLFFVVLWMLVRHRHRMLIPTKERVLLFSLSLIGMSASLIGMWGTVATSWLPSLIPEGRWIEVVSGITLLALVVGWFCSEVPHVRAMLSEQRGINEREVALREQLQESFTLQQTLMTELDRLYREQAQTAVTDAITGLPNHRAVMSKIEEEVSRCQRTQGSCAVLFVDLDHFKHVNDTCGHQAGDAILREVGNRLRSTLRLEDFVGRYGGEEFTITLSGADPSEACQTAERLRRALASLPCIWQAEDDQPAVPIAVTASIGVAVYQLHGTTREALIESADRAMYQAKHSGRNRVCLADEEGVSSQEVRTAAMGEQTRERVAVQALTAAASAHDGATSAHAQRMVHLSEATARRLGRPEEELHLIRLAALLHDIGKLGIPRTILRKPGPLTEEEWALMHQHPDIGRLILEQTGGIFHFLSHVVVAHHERWDGEGYPNRLAGEAIPMSARILAVVDSFDAMVSDRPYREAMSVAEARAELQRCVGRQYDPQVVEVFLRVLDEEERGGGEVMPFGVAQHVPFLGPKVAQETETLQEPTLRVAETSKVLHDEGPSLPLPR